jgi:hypothetical protein
MTTPRQYRQGDILLIEIPQPSTPGKPIDPTNGRIIVASGELSGHTHAIQNNEGTARFFAGARPGAAGNLKFLLLTSTACLEHEEHRPIVLQPGWYEVRRQREYDPEGPASTGD